MRAKMTAIVALCLAFAGAARAETITVTIDKAAFVPAVVTARIGDTIVWENKDIVAHTATARDKSWDILTPRGKSGSLVVKSAGDIPYYCRLHPNMVGRLLVRE